MKVVKSVDYPDNREYDPALRLIEQYDQVMSLLPPDTAKLIDYLVETVISVRESQAWHRGLMNRREADTMLFRPAGEEKNNGR